MWSSMFEVDIRSLLKIFLYLVAGMRYSKTAALKLI